MGKIKDKEISTANFEPRITDTYYPQVQDVHQYPTLAREYGVKGGELQIFKGLSIDAGVIAALPYLHTRTTFHLISMTFHRQPLVPGRRRERESERERESQREATMYHIYLLIYNLSSFQRNQSGPKHPQGAQGPR
ncbi:unnamed protein product [Pleuronectes platessa]|uniref:Uncharacterized protein n=1 Tax=Pleuronectes platessa TaxID=8262 RepID=A0A9N7TIX2_PLEPL|nr:unnamed protein product [Pleuronectes platessa]